MAKIIQVARFTADGSSVERTFKGMGDAGAQMSQRVQQGARAIPPAMRAVDASAGVAKEKIDGLAGSTGSLGRVLGSLGPLGIASAAALGGLALAFTALEGATRGAVQQLGAIDVAAKRLGVSTDALQEWRFAAIGVGQAAEQADAAITAFSERLGEALIKRQGAGYETLTRALGFSADDVANMRDVEESLPRIIDRIAALGSEAEQLRAAKELGLEPFLAVIQQGSGAFDRAAQAAREMGYVIDRDLLARAAEFNGQWSQASEVIGVQFKSALVDLAPIFVSLARSIADATGQLVSFLDTFKDIEQRSARTLRQQDQRAMLAQLDLSSRHGLGVAEGGDAERGERILRAMGDGAAYSRTGSAIRGTRAERDARDLYAALAARRTLLQTEISDRAPVSTSGAPGLRTASHAAQPGVDTELQQARAFVDALRAEAEAREDLARIMSANVGLSREEAEAMRKQEEDLARLNDIRAMGNVISAEEFERLRQMRIARDDDNAARRRTEELARAEEQRAARVVAFERSVETPSARRAREVGEASAMGAEGASPESVQRAIDDINRRYDEMAAAQMRASDAGRVLEGILRGQIRNIDDLGRVLLELALDRTIQAFFENVGGAQSGKSGKTGGNGGFTWGGFASSFFSGIFGGGPKVAGGRMQPHARHPAAEQGPEIAVIGGWGHVLPNQTFEGLAMLGDMMRRASAAPAASAGAPRINVSLKNESGVEIESRADARISEDGMIEIDIALSRKVAGVIASGDADAAVGGRFGLSGRKTTRG